MSDLPDAIDSRLRELPTGLRDHIERTRQVAHEIAIRHGVDARLTDIGAAAHDLARALKRRQLLSEAERLGLSIGFVERREPMLLHGPVASAWLSEDDGYDCKAVIEAVRFHTTGRPDMGQVAKAVFLADKIDPRKVERAPFLKGVAETARSDMDAAIVEYLDSAITLLIEDGKLVHPMAVVCRNALVVGGAGR